jgi:hypothetical protein
LFCFFVEDLKTMYQTRRAMCCTQFVGSFRLLHLSAAVLNLICFYIYRILIFM